MEVGGWGGADSAHDVSKAKGGETGQIGLVWKVPRAKQLGAGNRLSGVRGELGCLKQLD